MTTVKKLRIVVGYPGDAALGREALSEVLLQPLFQAMQSEFSVHVEIVAWDTHSGPGIHEDGAQGWIDLALKIEEADIFVAIFHRRLGTEYRKGVPPRAFASGTAYELETAIECWRRNKRPQVWLCICGGTSPQGEPAPTPSAELAEYLGSVRADQYRFPLLFIEYYSWEHLRDRLSFSLFQAISNAGRIAEQSSVANALYYTTMARRVDVAAESLTARLSDIDVLLVQPSHSSESTSWHGRVFLYLNTNLTSSLHRNFSTAALTVLTMKPNTGLWDETSRTQGRMIGPNAVSFDVAFEVEASNLPVKMTISNVFANANQLGVSSTQGDTFVAGVVAISGVVPKIETTG